MISHTKSDVRGSGQLMPELRGRRIAMFGDSHEDHKHLSPAHSYSRVKSYEYGLSKESLRPEVLDEDESFLETPKPKQSRAAKARAEAMRQRAEKAKATRDFHKKFNSLGRRLHYRPEREPQRPLYVVCCDPEPKPKKFKPSGTWLGDGNDPRLTGEDLDNMLAEYL